MDDTVATVLDDALPEHDITEISGTGPSWNELNETVHIDTASGASYYLKYAVDGDGTRIARETAAIRYLTTNGDVTVPGIHDADPDAAVPYLLTDPMPGRPVIEADADADRETRRRHLRYIGRALATVHQHRFDSHGEIAGSTDGDLHIEPRSWARLLGDRVEFMRDLGPSDRFDHYFDAVHDGIADNAALLDEAPATLVHGDPAKPNCVLVGDAVGLLDWELAHIGDPARELRRAHRQLLGGFQRDIPDALVEILHDGYRDVAGSLPAGFHRREPIYAAVTYLGVCGFFEKYVEYRDESEAELADWVTSEMGRRLERVAELD